MEVIDEYAQKLINSGYGLEQTRNIIVAGLKGYEKKLKLSRDLANPRWKPLHVPASFYATARRHQKLLAKGNWFKKRKSPEDDEDQPEQSSSPAKRKCLTNSRCEDNMLSGGSRLDTTLPVPVDERDDNMIINLDKTNRKKK